MKFHCDPVDRPAEAAACPQLPLAPAVREAGNTAITRLNRALEATARSAGAVFVDVNEAFAGHAQCTSEPWLIGLEGLGNETVLHPTRIGQTEGFLAPFTAQAGTVDEILAWIADRETPSTPPSAAPSPPAPGAGGDADAAAPPVGGSGGGLPVTGPALYSIVGVGIALVGAGAIAFWMWRPRRVRTVVE